MEHFFKILSQQSPKPMLILVDGSSYLYRAFHALPALLNTKGFPTSAMYGCINMLKKLQKQYPDSPILVIFDSKEKTFRETLFPEYKAHRESMPDDLSKQIMPLQNIIRALGFPLLIYDGVEADDLIGTLAKIAESHQIKTLIATGDKDMAQLVNNHIQLLNTMTDKMLDESGVVEKFGVNPNQIIDYLALVGDTSDNIPGVPKVGPKTAAKWLQQYQTIHQLIANAHEITGKVGEYFREHIPNLPRNQILVTIKTDLDLPYSENDLTPQAPDDKKLMEYFKEYEFKSWLNELLEKNSGDDEERYAHYLCLDTKEKWQDWLLECQKNKIIAIDTETTSLDYMQAKLVGVSFALAEGKAAYLPLAHVLKENQRQLSLEDVRADLQALLNDVQYQKIGHHFKYDLEIFLNHGLSVSGTIYDSLLESQLLDASSNGHDLDTLSLKHLKTRTIPFEAVAGKGKSQITFDQVDVTLATRYAAEDADMTWRLHQSLMRELEKLPELIRVFQDIELPLLPILANMERHGVLIDAHILNEHSIYLREKAADFASEAYSIAGREFNLLSPKQLQGILFEELKLPILEKTPSGQPSTSEHSLSELALEFRLPQLILEYRQCTKLISTYTERLVELMNPKTQRVHTSYHQIGTSTGRLSSSNPNLQNIPIKRPWGMKIREAFIAPEKYFIVSADYSQIELRLMAHISGDEGLCRAFANDQDIHRATAAEVFGVALDQVTSDQRRNAKAINFGLIYGMSAFGLAKQLNISNHEAEEYIQLYFSRYPKVKAFMDTTKQYAHEHAHVKTLFGRILQLPDIRSGQFMRRRAAERVAINMPLQGSSADLIKLAMIQINQWIQSENLKLNMIMQVHDELVFEVHESILESAIQKIRFLMENAAKFSVPLKVGIGYAKNWGDASKSH